MPKARKMLSDWDVPYIQSLAKLIDTQSKVTLAIWAIDYAEQVILHPWSKYYLDDLLPQNTLNAAREWLSGAIKLPRAKMTILECHAVARESDGNSVVQAIARAIGQSASTIHTRQGTVSALRYMER